MTDPPGRRDRLAPYLDQARGSMALVTERTRQIGPIRCEVCNIEHPGGVARGVVLDEPGGDTVWLLWVLADGWSVAEHGQIAVCSQHQTDPLLKTIRFSDLTNSPRD